MKVELVESEKVWARAVGPSGEVGEKFQRTGGPLEVL